MPNETIQPNPMGMDPAGFPQGMGQPFEMGAPPPEAGPQPGWGSPYLDKLGSSLTDDEKVLVKANKKLSEAKARQTEVDAVIDVHGALPAIERADTVKRAREEALISRLQHFEELMSAPPPAQPTGTHFGQDELFTAGLASLLFPHMAGQINEGVKGLAERRQQAEYQNMMAAFGQQQHGAELGYNRALDESRSLRNERFDFERMGIGRQVDLERMGIGRNFQVEDRNANFQNQLAMMAKENEYHGLDREDSQTHQIAMANLETELRIRTQHDQQAWEGKRYWLEVMANAQDPEQARLAAGRLGLKENHPAVQSAIKIGTFNKQRRLTQEAFERKRIDLDMQRNQFEGIRTGLAVSDYLNPALKPPPSWEQQAQFQDPRERATAEAQLKVLQKRYDDSVSQWSDKQDDGTWKPKPENDVNPEILKRKHSLQDKIDEVAAKVQSYSSFQPMNPGPVNVQPDPSLNPDMRGNLLQSIVSKMPGMGKTKIGQGPGKGLIPKAKPSKSEVAQARQEALAAIKSLPQGDPRRLKLRNEFKAWSGEKL